MAQDKKQNFNLNAAANKQKPQLKISIPDEPEMPASYHPSPSDRFFNESNSLRQRITPEGAAAAAAERPLQASPPTAQTSSKTQKDYILNRNGRKVYVSLPIAEPTEGANRPRP